MKTIGLCLAFGVMLAVALSAAAQPAAEEPIARDLHEEVKRISVTVKDLYNRQETRQIPVTIHRPAGDGPHPLVILNHGRANQERRAAAAGTRLRYETLSRYLVTKGFVVLTPTRVGYGETYGDYDPETTGGSCNSPRLEPLAIAASDQVLATLEFAKTLPYVNASRWIVAGQSVGGVATLATVWRNPPGLVGGINFAGGAGGNPDTSPGHPCSPQELGRLLGRRASDSKVPTLWLYWENDLYWGADHPKRWHEAWVKGGGQAELHTLAARGKDGHGAINFDMDHWVPIAESFFARLGFDKPGLIVRPGASAHAQVDDADKVPVSKAAREGSYQKFLEARKPRAYAIGPKGATGWATGDWAMGRALGFCQRRGETCRLYAVDDEVVWSPPQ